MNRVLFRGGLATAVVATCACGSDVSVRLEATVDTPSVGSFEGAVDPDAGSVTITTVGASNALFGPIPEGSGGDSVTVSAANVRFDGACGPGLSGVICFDVTVQSFFDVETLRGTWASLVSLSPSSGFEPVNPERVGVPAEIAGGIAQWSYGDVTSALSCTGDRNTVTWIFNYANATFSFRGEIYSDPVPPTPESCTGGCTCDGCSCEQVCETGGCDFACNGGDCTFGPSFENSVCSDASCAVSCNDFADSCDLQCTGSSACDFQCPQGYCDTACEDESDCTMTCGSQPSFLAILFGLEACELQCAAGATCLLDCNGSRGCAGDDLTCAGGTTVDCGGGVYACNRPCP